MAKNYTIGVWPSFIPWAERVVVRSGFKKRASIRFHHRLEDRSIVSLDWVDRTSKYATGVAYKAFEKLMHKRGVRTIETECHPCSWRMAKRLGYEPHSRPSNNPDEEYFTVRKVLREPTSLNTSHLAHDT